MNFLEIWKKWNTTFAILFCALYSSFKLNIKFEVVRKSKFQTLPLAPWKSEFSWNFKSNSTLLSRLHFTYFFRVRRAISFAIALLSFPSERTVGFENFYGRVECSLGCFLLAAKLQSWTWIIPSQSHTFSTLKEQLFIKLNYSAT